MYVYIYIYIYIYIHRERERDRERYMCICDIVAAVFVRLGNHDNMIMTDAVINDNISVIIVLIIIQARLRLIMGPSASDTNK